MIKTKEDYKATDSSDSRFPKGATIITRTVAYDYNSAGILSSITYLEGTQIDGTTTITTVEKDEHDNRTLLQQLWREDDGTKNYSAINIEYEYYK